MNNIINFGLRNIPELGFYGYKCNQSGDNSGQYVPLAEYQELRRLLERVDAIQLDYKLVLVDESYYYNYKEDFPSISELAKLLADIKEALK